MTSFILDIHLQIWHDAPTPEQKPILHQFPHQRQVCDRPQRPEKPPQQQQQQQQLPDNQEPRESTHPANNADQHFRLHAHGAGLSNHRGAEPKAERQGRVINYSPFIWCGWQSLAINNKDRIYMAGKNRLAIIWQLSYCNGNFSFTCY